MTKRSCSAYEKGHALKLFHRNVTLLKVMRTVGVKDVIEDGDPELRKETR